MAKPLNICLFEDEFTYRLLPLVHMRPVYDLRCGILTVREKYRHLFPQATFSLHCRPLLEAVVREENPGVPVNEFPSAPTLFINGRVLPDDRLLNLLKSLPGEDRLFVEGVVVVAAFLSGKNLDLVRATRGEPLSAEHLADVPKEEVQVTLVDFLWDFIHRNEAELRRDYSLLVKKAGRRIRGIVDRRAVLLNRKHIMVGRGSIIKPGVVLDAQNGPIVIGEKVTILPNATIIGPAFIGNGSIVKVGAQIYGATTVGPVCKVGGEIEGSILQGYSNKQHGGFLGHSYIGEWVNLGAGTNNSDLKNNYSTVRVDLGYETVDSGLQFIGLMMGDHSKSGIGTLFNTGTVVGVFCNIFGAGFPPKYIPSFSWGGADRLEPYDVHRAIEVARQVMARRGVTLTQVEERLIYDLFVQTEPERLKRSVVKKQGSER